MDQETFKRRVKDLEDKFYNLDPDAAIPDYIVRENNALLEFEPDNIDLLEMKALILESTYPLNYDEIISVYDHILKLVPPKSAKAKDALEMINIYKFSSNLEDNYNDDCNYSSGSSEYFAFINIIPYGLIIGIKAVIIIIFLYFLFNKMYLANQEKALTDSLNNVNNSASQELKYNDSDFEDIKINAPADYKYKTKSEIYNLRKKYVSQSKFASKNYEPNELIFGGIVDGKPWWGLLSCGQIDYEGDYHERIEGPSKVSIQMNNPDALVQISLPYLVWDTGDNKEYCNGQYSKFIPYSLKYSKKDNVYVIKYELTRKFLDYRTNINGKSYRYPLQLSGLNARDFGYKYVYAFNTNNIKMFSYSDNDMTNSVIEFADYVHLGGSCKYKDGCNNISPMQDGLMFRVTELPATISLKLWKNNPVSNNSKPDLYYQIIFDER